MRFALPFLLSAVLVSSAAAQSPEYAATFAAIEAVSAAQLPALRNDLRLTYAQVKGGRELIDGLSALREYELTGDRRRASEAETLLERARNAASSNAWFHYAYALALAHGPDVQTNGSVLRVTGRSWAQELGFDTRAKARRAAERALELDSLHAGAAVIVGEIALQFLEADALHTAEHVLERVANTNAAAATTLARVQNQLGSQSAALVAAQRAVALEPANARARLALAVALLQTPGQEQKGASEYFAAIAQAPPELSQRLFEEVRPIATHGDSARWRTTSPAKRRQFFETFWDVHAAMSAVSVPERIAEHYRRLTYALREYPRSGEGPMSSKSLILEKSTLPVDQRGELYIRHGAPWRILNGPPPPKNGEIAKPILTRDVAYACDVLSYDPAGEAWRAYAGDQHDSHVRITLASRMPASKAELWVYKTDTGTELHALVKCLHTADYVIPYDLPCTMDWIPDIVQQSFDVHACGRETPERRRVISREALVTDTHRPVIDRRIPIDFDMLAFRGSGGRTDLLIPLALGADSILSTSVPGGQRYGFRILASVIDTAAQRVEQTDTTVQMIAASVLSGSLLSLHALVSATPTKEAFFRLRADNTQAEHHTALTEQHISVPSYRGDTLMISDVVLGAPVEGGNFSRGGRRVALLPFAHSVDGRFSVFYEVYNLPRGTQYRTQLLVEKSGGGAQDGLRLEFTDESVPDGDGVVRVLRTMGTELKPGRYRLTLRVMLDDNHFVEKTRLFIVGG